MATKFTPLVFLVGDFANSSLFAAYFSNALFKFLSTGGRIKLPWLSSVGEEKLDCFVAANVLPVVGERGVTLGSLNRNCTNRSVCCGLPCGW